MDELQIDALVASVARNVYYASGFWTRSERGFQEPQAAVVLPRDPAKPATLIVPEFGRLPDRDAHAERAAAGERVHEHLAHCVRARHPRAGVTTHDAWAAICKITCSMDVPTPRKALGFIHMIGLDIIELPSGYPPFGRLKNFILEENTVINFEYLRFGRGVAPYRFESSYLIGRDGAEFLHTLTHELFVAS